jgi:hypothetical protein
MIRNKIRPYYNSALDILLLFALCLALVAGGCARHTHSTTTAEPGTAATTTVEPGTGATVTTTEPAVHTTTTTTETEEEHPHSLLGSIFYAVGEIVALPFKLVGGLFDAIF